ncbi:ferredoxin [Candidatus Bipolaricaulota bacterium]|nr:ferredoxin [Candidatus Bipolaricaulota bacterium]
MANPTVDKDLCIGCALCALVCTEVFEMDDASRVALVKADADLDADCIEDAIDQCPVTAIVV